MTKPTVKGPSAESRVRAKWTQTRDPEPSFTLHMCIVDGRRCGSTDADIAAKRRDAMASIFPGRYTAKSDEPFFAAAIL